MKRVVKTVLISTYAIMGIGLAGIFIIRYNQNIYSTDYPTRLSGKEEILELTYIAWACDCAAWAKTEDMELYHDSPNDTLPQLSLFIEAASSAVRLPEEYEVGCCGNRIRFTGRFYEDKGISRDYQQKTEQKPDPARVFKYTKYELVKPYTAGGFSVPENSEIPTKVIR